jgi:hypothetical protein
MISRRRRDYDGEMFRPTPSPSRTWLRLGIILAMTSVAGAAWSRSGGISGKSGKQGSTCNQCHGGGTTPTVKLDGPRSLDAGMLANYTFSITTVAVATGMNAATTEGTLIEDGDGGNTRLEDDEITHVQKTKPDAGVALYRFSMTAPQYGGTISLYAAGNAVNGDDEESGDESAKDKIDIVVNGPPRPPPPEAGPPAPGPTSTADASTSKDAGREGGSAAASPEEDSGCTIGWSDRSSAPAGAMLAGLVALAAVGRSRRRR